MTFSLAARPRRWFAIYLCFVGLLSIYYAFRHMQKRDGYAMGDVLINYTAGFVRRGLLGELLRRLSHVTHISALWLGFLVQAAAFLIFLAAVYRLTEGLRWTYTLTALLLSPATCAFMALNPAQAMRKEILLYAVFSMFCLPFVARLRDWQLIAALTLLAPALVLTHDILAIYMPYLFGIIVLQRTGEGLTGLGRAIKLMIVPAIATLAACIAVYTHPGNLAMATTICSSLGDTIAPFGTMREGHICDGAIYWLDMSFAQAHQFTQAFIALRHLYRVYIPLLPVVFLPIAILLYSLYRQRRRETQLILACTLVAFAASALLWYATVDWGRWISIHAICLMLLVLLVLRRMPQTAGPQPLPASRRLAASFAVFLYAFAWALPPVPLDNNERGYIGLYLYFRPIHGHSRT